MKDIINIGIAEDHDLLRQGLIALLKPYKNVNVLFDVGNGKDVLENLKITRPDILLLDIEMPIMGAQEVLEKIGKKYPKVKVIIVSAFFQSDYIIECFKLGVKAFLRKDHQIDRVIEAIVSVYENGIYSDNEVTKILANAIQSTRQQSARAPIFTSQELQVLKLICSGLSRKKAAEVLEVQPDTVNFHLRNIMRKTNIHSTPGLITYAIRQKIISP